jgi:hypothetical protein
VSEQKKGRALFIQEKMDIIANMDDIEETCASHAVRLGIVPLAFNTTVNLLKPSGNFTYHQV